jgi:hypothetical protein
MYQAKFSGRNQTQVFADRMISPRLPLSARDDLIADSPAQPAGTWRGER